MKRSPLLPRSDEKRGGWSGGPIKDDPADLRWIIVCTLVGIAAVTGFLLIAVGLNR